MKALFFSILILFFLQNSAAQEIEVNEKTQTQISELAATKQWKKLLYFEGRKSLVDNKNFFLSEKPSPQSEALAAYKNFFLTQEEIKDGHPICMFPARFLLLSEKLNRLNEFSKIGKCKKLSSFLKRMTGESVSLIFSSYYLNNPSSAFGHTFLKINRSEKADLDLLNYGINYAATVGQENAVFYALKGLMGFFKGEFTAVPYYYKVREYNDYESRDLWEYKLNLSPKEVALLHLHIWELGRGWSQYYFLSGNCSFWAIKVLEAIKPDYNFSQYFGSSFVIPVETIKSLYKFDGFIKDVKYRPSLRKQVISRVNKISDEEMRKVKALVKKVNEKNITEDELKKEKPETLETAILLYDYTNAPDYTQKEKELLANKQVLLNARSSLPMTAPEPETTPNLKYAPHQSHPPRRLGLGTFNTKSSNTTSYRLSYKQGFHELLDSKVGFNPHMALNFLDLSFLISEDETGEHKLNLEHFYAINIDAFTPISKLDQQFSWRLNLGVDSERFLLNQNNLTGFVNFDSGLSKDFFKNQSLLLYFLVSNTLEANGRLKHNLRISLAPLVGAKLSILNNTNIIGEARPSWFYNFEDKIQFVAQYSLKFQTYIPKLHTALYLSGQYAKTQKAEENYNLTTGLRYFF